MDWQPIETAPKDGTDILLVGVKGIGTACPIYIGWWCAPPKEWVNTYSGKAQFPPSHWMPLPEPPPRIRPAGRLTPELKASLESTRSAFVESGLSESVAVIDADMETAQRLAAEYGLVFDVER